MFLKLIVLALFIAAILVGFSVVNRRKLNRKETSTLNNQTDPEETESCDICGTFVAIKTKNCGRQGCPY